MAPFIEQEKKLTKYYPMPLPSHMIPESLVQTQIFLAKLSSAKLRFFRLDDQCNTQIFCLANQCHTQMFQLKNDDDLKNEDDFKNKVDLKNKDDLKNENNLVSISIRASGSKTLRW